MQSRRQLARPIIKVMPRLLMPCNVFLPNRIWSHRRPHNVLRCRYLSTISVISCRSVEVVSLLSSVCTSKFTRRCCVYRKKSSKFWQFHLSTNQSFYRRETTNYVYDKADTRLLLPFVLYLATFARYLASLSAIVVTTCPLLLADSAYIK